jgi:hypothetical protein
VPTTSFVCTERPLLQVARSATGTKPYGLPNADSSTPLSPGCRMSSAEPATLVPRRLRCGHGPRCEQLCTRSPVRVCAGALSDRLRAKIKSPRRCETCAAAWQPHVAHRLRALSPLCVAYISNSVHGVSTRISVWLDRVCSPLSCYSAFASDDIIFFVVLDTHVALQLWAVRTLRYLMGAARS